MNFDARKALDAPEFNGLGEAKGRIAKWLEEPSIDTASKSEVSNLIEKKNVSELRERFYRDLEFGTGGLRGVLGAGSNRMNKYIVRRTTQGLSNYINKFTGGKGGSVAIAHDSRHCSDLFAREAASVFAANGIEVFLFKTLQTTPCLSYALRYLKCTSGVCVTASHNPPQYNGFKVYWDDGAQIVPPHDAKILDEVFQIQSFSEAKFLDFDEALNKGLVKWVPDEVLNSYYETLTHLQLYPELKKDICIAYTPLHGTGAVPVATALQRWGYNNLHMVPEQKDPNGDFPTVKKPNPEEPEALRMVADLAKQISADVAMASDPDSDRLAVIVRDPKAAHGTFAHQAIGDYILLNGNQTGALLIDYVLNGMSTNKKLRASHKIVKTIVTSDLHSRICKKHDIEIFDTLTGFKWIAALVRSWENEGKKFEYLFGTEESFGFMPGSYVRDKDGVGALCQAAEMVAKLKSEGKTACDRLLELFREFGAWQEDLINVDLVGEAGAQRIGRIMDHTRNHPFTSLAGARISKIYDYKLKVVKARNSAGQVNTSNETLSLPKSDVLQFVLEDGSKISMRPSGTEPKLKIYVSVCTEGSDVLQSYKTTQERVANLRKELNAYIETVS